jgi:secreted trypsin-like serine protease
MWQLQITLLLTIPFLTLGIGFGNQTEQRIMHGNHLDIDEAPYLVAIISDMRRKDITFDNVFGTGTILTDKYVITVAHLFLETP